ncbi:unnamed protein product [Toxocara canis]|uniref:Uncharacterized protein n=1 Tax=Toxocara canis TaxID=6265 RepID=A0A3P7GY19_TOXCA|nr:unnamed protein product [Toxocara canis]
MRACQTQDGDGDGRRLCPQTPRQDAVRLRRLNEIRLTQHKLNPTALFRATNE